MSARTLTDADVEAIACRVAALIAITDTPAAPRLVDAATLAALLGVSRATVYERADDLGAIRLGDGPRARLRFDPAAARAALEAEGATPPINDREAPTPRPAAPHRRHRKRPAIGHVLRVGGRDAA